MGAEEAKSILMWIGSIGLWKSSLIAPILQTQLSMVSAERARTAGTVVV